MAAAIIRGVLKGKVKPKPKPQHPKKVGERSRTMKKSTHDKFLSRAAVLGGARSAISKKTPIVSKFQAGVGVGGAGVLGTQAILKKHKAKKDAKAASDKKLKKALDRHQKKTKDKRKEYRKHHG